MTRRLLANLIAPVGAAGVLDATTGAGNVHLLLAGPTVRSGLAIGAGTLDAAVPSAVGGYRVDADAGAGKVDVGGGRNPGGSRTVMARPGAGDIGVHVP